MSNVALGSRAFLALREIRKSESNARKTRITRRLKHKRYSMSPNAVRERKAQEEAAILYFRMGKVDK